MNFRYINANMLIVHILEYEMADNAREAFLKEFEENKAKMNVDELIELQRLQDKFKAEK